MKDYSSLTPFFELLCEYQRVERLVYVPQGGGRKENNVEHSYLLAMLAWYIIEKDKLVLDIDRVLRYALVHDLVEVYAGDTSLFDAQARVGKKEREQEAQRKLAEKFTDFSALHETIERYEAQEDAESRFIKALDKLQPMFASYLEGGTTWKEQGVTLSRIIELKRECMDKAPEIKPYFDSFVEHLRTHPELFAQRIEE
jgi:putative hydrolases of HD superfamily